MKTIKNLIITFFVIVAIVGVTVIGGYIYVRTTHGIDLFRTAEQLKTLSKDVDESALCPNAYGNQGYATFVLDRHAKGDIGSTSLVPDGGVVPALCITL